MCDPIDHPKTEKEEHFRKQTESSPGRCNAAGGKDCTGHSDVTSWPYGGECVIPWQLREHHRKISETIWLGVGKMKTQLFVSFGKCICSFNERKRSNLFILFQICFLEKTQGESDFIQFPVFTKRGGFLSFFGAEMVQNGTHTHTLRLST